MTRKSNLQTCWTSPPFYVFFVLPARLRSPAPTPALATGDTCTAAAESSASCAARALRFWSSLILAAATQLRMCIVMHLELRAASHRAARRSKCRLHDTQTHEYQKGGEHGHGAVPPITIVRALDVAREIHGDEGDDGAGGLELDWGSGDDETGCYKNAVGDDETGRGAQGGGGERGATVACIVAYIQLLLRIV